VPESTILRHLHNIYSKYPFDRIYKILIVKFFSRNLEILSAIIHRNSSGQLTLSSVNLNAVIHLIIRFSVISYTMASISPPFPLATSNSAAKTQTSSVKNALNEAAIASDGEGLSIQTVRSKSEDHI